MKKMGSVRKMGAEAPRRLGSTKRLSSLKSRFKKYLSRHDAIKADDSTSRTSDSSGRELDEKKIHSLARGKGKKMKSSSSSSSADDEKKSPSALKKEMMISSSDSSSEEETKQIPSKSSETKLPFLLQQERQEAAKLSSLEETPPSSPQSSPRFSSETQKDMVGRTWTSESSEPISPADLIHNYHLNYRGRASSPIALIHSLSQNESGRYPSQLSEISFASPSSSDLDFGMPSENVDDKPSPPSKTTPVKVERPQSARHDEQKGVWRCQTCDWICPVQNPSSRLQREHKKHCGEIINVKQWLGVVKNDHSAENKGIKTSPGDLEVSMASTSPEKVDSETEHPTAKLDSEDDEKIEPNGSTAPHEAEEQSKLGDSVKTGVDSRGLVGKEDPAGREEGKAVGGIHDLAAQQVAGKEVEAQDRPTDEEVQLLGNGEQTKSGQHWNAVEDDKSDALEGVDDDEAQQVVGRGMEDQDRPSDEEVPQEPVQVHDGGEQIGSKKTYDNVVENEKSEAARTNGYKSVHVIDDEPKDVGHFPSVSSNEVEDENSGLASQRAGSGEVESLIPPNDAAEGMESLQSVALHDEIKPENERVYGQDSDAEILQSVTKQDETDNQRLGNNPLNSEAEKLEGPGKVISIPIVSDNTKNAKAEAAEEVDGIQATPPAGDNQDDIHHLKSDVAVAKADAHHSNRKTEVVEGIETIDERKVVPQADSVCDNVEQKVVDTSSSSDDHVGPGKEDRSVPLKTSEEAAAHSPQLLEKLNLGQGKWVANSPNATSQHDESNTVTFSSVQKYWADVTRSEYMLIEGRRSPSFNRTDDVGFPSLTHWEGRRSASPLSQERFEHWNAKSLSPLASTSHHSRRERRDEDKREEDKGITAEADVQHEPSSSGARMVGYDFEQAVREQNSHDLICPVCGSCVTERVILRKRKRTLVTEMDGRSPKSREIISDVNEDHNLQLEPPVEDNDDETWGCLACLSYFIRRGVGRRPKALDPGAEGLQTSAALLSEMPEDKWERVLYLTLFPPFRWGPARAEPGIQEPSLMESTRDEDIAKPISVVRVHIREAPLGNDGDSEQVNCFSYLRIRHRQAPGAPLALEGPGEIRQALVDSLADQNEQGAVQTPAAVVEEAAKSDSSQQISDALVKEVPERKVNENTESSLADQKPQSSGQQISEDLGESASLACVPLLLPTFSWGPAMRKRDSDIHEPLLSDKTRDGGIAEQAELSPVGRVCLHVAPLDDGDQEQVNCFSYLQKIRNRRLTGTIILPGSPGETKEVPVTSHGEQNKEVQISAEILEESTGSDSSLQTVDTLVQALQEKGVKEAASSTLADQAPEIVDQQIPKEVGEKAEPPPGFGVQQASVSAPVGSTIAAEKPDKAEEALVNSSGERNKQTCAEISEEFTSSGAPEQTIGTLAVPGKEATEIMLAGSDAVIDLNIRNIVIPVSAPQNNLEAELRPAIPERKSQREEGSQCLPILFPTFSWGPPVAHRELGVNEAVEEEAIEGLPTSDMQSEILERGQEVQDQLEEIGGLVSKLPDYEQESIVGLLDQLGLPLSATNLTKREPVEYAKLNCLPNFFPKQFNSSLPVKADTEVSSLVEHVESSEEGATTSHTGSILAAEDQREKVSCNCLPDELPAFSWGAPFPTYKLPASLAEKLEVTSRRRSTKLTSRQPWTPEIIKAPKDLTAEKGKAVVDDSSTTMAVTQDQTFEIMSTSPFLQGQEVNEILSEESETPWPKGKRDDDELQKPLLPSVTKDDGIATRPLGPGPVGDLSLMDLEGISRNRSHLVSSVTAHSPFSSDDPGMVTREIITEESHVEVGITSNTSTITMKKVGSGADEEVDSVKVDQYVFHFEADTKDGHLIRAQEIPGPNHLETQASTGFPLPFDGDSSFSSPVNSDKLEEAHADSKGKDRVENELQTATPEGPEELAQAAGAIMVHLEPVDKIDEDKISTASIQVGQGSEQNISSAQQELAEDSEVGRCSCLPTMPLLSWQYLFADHHSSQGSSQQSSSGSVIDDVRKPLLDETQREKYSLPGSSTTTAITVVEKVESTITIEGSTDTEAAHSAISTAKDISAAALVQPTGGRTQEILKSIVYGGLDVTFVSLGVVSSSAGGDAKTITVIAMGLANLVFGLIIFFRAIFSLYYNNQTQFLEEVGQSLQLNGFLAMLSFLFFGALAPITYGFSFQHAPNRNYKFAATCAVALCSVVFLGAAKAHVTSKSAIRVISMLVAGGFLAAIAGYETGGFVSQLLQKIGFDSV